MAALYGLVDTARDPRLHRLVLAGGAQACLFAGAIDAPLDRAAPYLARLVPGEPLAEAWRAEGWGQAWGILCRSGLEFSALRRHFRRFLQARLPDGKVVLFRYYDPRVWRTYLPTCEGETLAAWFAGIDEYLAEGEAGGTLRYRHAGGALVTEGP